MTDQPSEKPQPRETEAATVLPPEAEVNAAWGPSGYYVQAHDGRGRPILDERGHPVLVSVDQQKPGMNATLGIRVLVGIQIVLLLAALVVGIVVAVEVHHLTTTSSSDVFGSLRATSSSDHGSVPGDMSRESDQ